MDKFHQFLMVFCLPHNSDGVLSFYVFILPDMRAERNILAIEVYPYLRKFCSQLGLDFQVVDMRWGVTEVSQNDHSVEKLCLLEVENCQKTSRGPNFVVKFSPFNS